MKVSPACSTAPSRGHGASCASWDGAPRRGAAVVQGAGGAEPLARETIASRLGRRSLREGWASCRPAAPSTTRTEVAELRTRCCCWPSSSTPAPWRCCCSSVSLCAGTGGHAHPTRSRRPFRMGGRALRPASAGATLVPRRGRCAQPPDRMEMALRACTLWLWLDLRFRRRVTATVADAELRGALNDGIERQLGGKRPLAQLRRRHAPRALIRRTRRRAARARSW